MLDAHQHFWRISRGDYHWMAKAPEILRRDYLPNQLLPLLEQQEVTQTVLVQAAQTTAETDFLLMLAATAPFVSGVVGWLDLENPEFPHLLGRYRSQPKYLGLRPMLQDLPDDDWILRPSVLNHLRLLADREVPFDVLIYPRHLSSICKMLELIPGLRAVIDHAAKPPIVTGTSDRWRAGIATAARFPNVYCKISGLITEAPAQWTARDLAPYVDHVLACFGPERLLFGSDWPVCLMAGTYADVVQTSKSLLVPHLNSAELRAVFGENARRFYRVE